MATQTTIRTVSKLNRRAQSEHRKRQIIEATLDCIDRSGLSQLTLDKIAAQAGITKGNLVFHFTNRDNLLGQSLQFLNNEYLSCWREKLAQASDQPAEQLRALIDARFSPQVCNRKKISIWYAFWGEIRARPDYQKIRGDSDLAYSDALLQCCHALCDNDSSSLDAETSAMAIEGMIDGLWQDMLISKQAKKRADAAAAVHRLTAALFPATRITEQ